MFRVVRGGDVPWINPGPMGADCCAKPLEDGGAREGRCEDQPSRQSAPLEGRTDTVLVIVTRASGLGAHFGPGVQSCAIVD
jgi:hypothetical protein